MRRTLRSTIAIASAVALAAAGCKSTAASESTPAAEVTPAPESVTDDAASEAVDGPTAEVTETRDGVLLDYYRDDSRGTIQTMEGQLKPLEVVQPDEPDKSPVE